MSIFFRSFRTFFKRPARGFTLVELLVVVGIVIVISSLILFRHSRFDSTTLLRSLSYSVALSVRQAQVYGTSVRGVGLGSSVTYAPGHGVHFSAAAACSSGNPATCYHLFADADGDRAWESAETVLTPTLGRSFTIGKFCAVTSGGTESCSSTGAIDWLTIYFRRPNPEAFFYTSAGGTYAYAYIELQSSADLNSIRRVKVTNVGQIAVCSPADTVSSC